jgi:hypothetical protein
MPGPVRQSNLVVNSAVAPASVTGATINGVEAGNCLVAIVIAYYPAGTDTDLVTGYGTTIAGSASNTFANALRVRRGDASGWYTELTAWVAPNVSAGNTIGKPTFALTGSHWVFTHMDEWAGIATTSPVDETDTDSVAAAAGTASITVGPTGTLSQASQVVIAAAGNRYNYIWNGGYGSGNAPSTYTVLRGITDNTGGAVGQSVYKEVTSTAAVSATWTFADGYGPAVAGIFTLKTSSATLRLEVDDIDTEITGTTGWTFWAWAGDPDTAPAAKKWTAYAATIVSGKLVFPDAPPGATDASTWNVMGYQPSGTLTTGFMTGTVREA